MTGGGAQTIYRSLTEEDVMLARALSCVKMLPGGWDKRFRRGLLQDISHLGITEQQRHWLWKLVVRYRRQISRQTLLAAGLMTDEGRAETELQPRLPLEDEG